MPSLEKCLGPVLLLCGTALCPTGAPAATVIATLQSTDTGDQANARAISPGGPTIAAQALDGKPDSSFYAFCLDPDDAASLNASYDFTATPLANAEPSGR
jgi:hypothetical protein